MPLQEIWLIVRGDFGFRPVRADSGEKIKPDRILPCVKFSCESDARKAIWMIEAFCGQLLLKHWERE